jgi:hypothetical protein
LRVCVGTGHSDNRQVLFIESLSTRNNYDDKKKIKRKEEEDIKKKL